MKNKTQRLLAIKDIITENEVSSQDQLLKELRKRGFDYTQATLSRDLRFLKVSKVVDAKGEYQYILPENEEAPSINRQPKVQLTGFVSITFSNHLAVIKTLPGFAPSIATRIDNAAPYEIVGTIAGDDTILIIPREGVPKSDLIHILALVMPEIREQIANSNK